MISSRSGRKVAAWVWLLVVLTLGFTALRQGAVIDTSLMALLPASEQQPLIKRATEQQAAAYADKLLLVISAEDELLARTGVQLAVDRLKALDTQTRLTWQAPDSETAVDELYPYRFTLLSQETRTRLSTGNGSLQYQLALQRLLNPISGFGSDPLQDPFGLYTDLMLSLQSDVPVYFDSGLLRLKASEQPAYLLSLQLLEDPFSLSVQHTVNAVLEPLMLELAQQGISLHRSGLLLHAAAGAEQARTEMSTIGLGSLLGIILLITFVFRSPLPLVLVLLPVATGALMAVAATQLLFGRVHMITVAFGAGLVGVAVDYALHFLCEARVLPLDRIIRKLFAGLLLGLISSVLAYAGLALAPFPGLRQMAVFCAVGLIAAWLTVLFWLPVLSCKNATGQLPAAVWLNRWRSSCPRISQSSWLAGLLLVLSLGSIVVIWQGEARDDVTLLQTSPHALLQEDRRVQSLLGNGSSAAFLLVTGKNFEQVLQTEERIQSSLMRLRDEASLQGFKALSQVLPSQQRQMQSAQRVRALYASQWPRMANLLKLSPQQRATALENMQQAAGTVLTPREWQQLLLSKAWSQHIISDGADVATVIQLQGDVSQSLKQSLINLAEQEPAVYFVDRVSDMSDLLARYRAEITSWLLLAYGCVVLMLVLRYRQRCWRILLPPLLASLMTFAGFQLLTDGYNLFNLIALMLVLGVGLDMGIFLNETGDSDHTWLAVSLSALSSLLAFGLLALSQTPVLYHFGVIILPGLLLTWLLATLMRNPSTGETTNGRVTGTL
ncbi:putative exporter [Marinobacterium halophilum]|uniref:Putative exporter n=1 Tax=Marinobacterium halophilum TaxID=267374 RepID=A0A2P8F4L9_9GAMM|nr:hypothetical protein [Marinobacterium halophilum]PSL16643.1 putative exporter [Marinobacterium halophilum]